MNHSDLLMIDVSKEAMKLEDEEVEKRKYSLFGRKYTSDTLLTVITLIGAFFGLLLGFLLRLAHPTPTSIELIKFPGEILMRMLKMMIIPIICTSIIAGLSHMEAKKGGKIAIHTLAFYLSTTTIASFLGLALVFAVRPGDIHRHTYDDVVTQKEKLTSTLDTILDLIRNLFPSNIVTACFQMDITAATKAVEANSTNATSEIVKSLEIINSSNVLGLIMVSIFFGIVLARSKDQHENITQFITSLNELFMKMIIYVMWFAPFGICSLIAGNLIDVKGNMGDVLKSVGMYLMTMIVGLLIHSVIILSSIYWVFTRKNPFKFYAGIPQVMLTGFGMNSSAATLPVTIKCAEKNLHIDQRITRFVLPLGATMNMDATSVFQAVASITIAQMHQIPLDFGKVVTISLTGIMASIGAAAIPGSGMVALTVVLSAAGLPTEAVGMLWTVDWILERCRVMVNVLGDCVCAGVIHHLHRDTLMMSGTLSLPTRSCKILIDGNRVEACSTTGFGPELNDQTLTGKRQENEIL